MTRIFQAHESVSNGQGDSSAIDSHRSLSNSEIASGTQAPELLLPLRRKRNIPKPDDLDFQQGSWAKLAKDVGIPLGPFQESNVTFTRISKILSLCPKLQRIPVMLLYVKSFRLTDDGAFATVKDPSGDMDASIHHSVLDEFKSDLVQGSSMIIRNACLLTVSPKRQVLNIVLRNVICVQSPPSNHLSTQHQQNPVLTCESHPSSSSSFQKLRDLQTSPPARQPLSNPAYGLSPVRSTAPYSPAPSLRQPHISESAGSLETFERVAPSQVRFAQVNPATSKDSGIESASSSSSASQTFVMQRVVPGLSQYLAAKRARESAAASQPERSALPAAGGSMHSPIIAVSQNQTTAIQVSAKQVDSEAARPAGATSGSSVGSGSSSGSSRGGVVRNWQSPFGAPARSSRLCDPDDESALEVD